MSKKMVGPREWAHMSPETREAMARDALDVKARELKDEMLAERNRIDRAWERYLFKVNELGAVVDGLASAIDNMADAHRAQNRPRSPFAYYRRRP